MCLDNRKTGAKKQIAIAAMPETFFVWKYFPGNELEYRCTRTEPRLTSPRWHKARYFPAMRSRLKYHYGFHVFIDEKEVRKYYSKSWTRKFLARRKDIQEIGKYNSNYNCLKGAVLSWIKPVNDEE